MINPENHFKVTVKQMFNAYTVFIWLLVLTTGINDLHGEKKYKQPERIDTINMKINNGSLIFQITFNKGKSHNHPTFAIWIEELDGRMIETLFVTQYFSTGIFGHADAGSGNWDKDAGEAIRPAALPYWSHKRNIINRDSIYAPTPENPVSDAVSGATPAGSFILNSSAKEKLPEQFRLLMEINQTWDWNEYWTNNKYPEDKNYKTSAQPSIVYETTISQKDTRKEYFLQAVGHGHYSGNDGELYKDISTLSTALSIADQIKVTILEEH